MLENPKILLIDFHNTIAPTSRSISKIFASVIARSYPNTDDQALANCYLNLVGTTLREEVRQGLEIAGCKKPSPAEVFRLSNTIWNELVKLKIKPFRGLASELRRLKKQGWKIFISTDNPQRVAEKMPSIVSLKGIFDGCLGQEPNQESIR